jgi:hypothetical protein
MSKVQKGSQSECDKLAYAVELIETLNAEEKSPILIVEVALQVLEFGQLTSKQLLDYIESTR